jgi:excisionase family DNA binding protein
MNLQSLSIANLAARWACSRSCIEDMIKDGRIVAMRLGPKTTRIPMATILEYERKCLTNGDGASTANVGSASSEQARIAAVQRSTRHRATVSRLTQRRQTQQSNG